MAGTVALRYVGVALQFVVLAVVARKLSPEDYGRYVFVLSVVLPTYFLFGLGASEAFLRTAPTGSQVRDDVAQLAGGTLLLCGVSALAVSAGSLLIQSTFGMSGSGSATAWFVAAFLIANGVMFNTSQLLLGVGKGQLGSFFFYPAVNLSLVAVAVPYLTWSNQPTFTGVAVASCGAALLVATVSMGLVCREVPIRWPAWKTMGSLIGIGLRLAAARAMYSAGLWIPAFFAGLLLTPTEAGILGTASRLAAAVTATLASTRFVVRPEIVRAYSMGRLDHLRKVCGAIATLVIVLTLSAVAVNALVGKRLIESVFGAGYISASAIMAVLLFGTVAESVGGPVDEVLKMTGRDRIVLGILFGGVVLLCVGEYAASSAGLYAMAWTQVAYSVAVFGTMIIAVRRSLGIWLLPASPVATIRTLRDRGGSGAS